LFRFRQGTTFAGLARTLTMTLTSPAYVGRATQPRDDVMIKNGV
jgi:hypothetical protein